MTEDKKLELKVQETKYKIIIFVLVVVALFNWNKFNDSFANVENLSNRYQNLNTERRTVENNILIAKENIDFLEYLSWKDLNIINCINSITCETSSIITWHDRINDDVLRYYYLLAKHNPNKMSFDQRLILRNINEFLFNKRSANSFWDINIISFWNPRVTTFQKWLYELPITINANFSDSDNLFNFINNIENRVFREFPVLYEIDSINYDIVKYDQFQTVNINLKAYYSM